MCSNHFCSSFILTRELFPFVKMLLHLWALFPLLPIVVFSADVTSNDFTNPLVLGYLYSAFLLVVTPYALNGGRREGHSSPSIRRERRSISSMFQELGPMYTRRSYRMDSISFWALHKKLRPHLKGRIRPASSSSKKKHRNAAVNGIIPSPTRLSIALRYFAGGSSYDISLTHGVSHTEVFNSVWLVVQAVNKCSELDIKFPSDHAKQREIATGFASKSAACFEMCAGAIDGILIWIEKPSVKDCERAGCGPNKFFCEKKTRIEHAGTMRFGGNIS